jgi:chitodextrinase
MKKTMAVCAAVLFLAHFVGSAHAQVSYTTQHNDNMRSGDNLSETILNQSNVNSSTFGMLFKETVDDQVYATPLYVPNLTINGAAHNAVFVATVNNTVYAFDADQGGAALWSRNFGPPPNHTQVGQACGSYQDFQGNIGIVGTPVIDESSNTMYFVAKTISGGTFTQTLHAINIQTGADRASSPSVVIAASGFNAQTNNQRPALTLANSKVYIAWASYCDTTPYNGFVMAYTASTLGQAAVLNITSTGGSSGEGGIWQSGQGLNVDSNGNLYAMTGNGTWDGVSNFGESFLKLNPTNLTVEDYFTPSDYGSLNNGDVDLGSGGALLIPGTNLIVGGGKAAIFYLLNTNNLGHETGSDSGAVQEFSIGNAGCGEGKIHGSPTYYNSSSLGPLIYVWSDNDYMHEFKFNGSTFPSTTAYINSSMTAAECGEPGVMLSVTANGNNDSTAIVWGNGVLSGDASHTTEPGILRAFNATNVNQELWDSQQNASRDSCGNFAKYTYPVVVNGKAYLASFGTANAGSGQLCVYGLVTGGGSCTTKPGAPTGLAATGTTSTGTTLKWTADTAPANCSISSYTVLKNGASIGTATGTSFAVSGLAASTNYSFTVEATDAAGTSAASSPVSVTTSASGGGEGPYPGPAAAAIPGTVMAQNYDTGGQGVAYNVTSTNGSANSYRSDGVDLEAATSPATGDDLGWTAAGQWFRYTVNVSTAGTYAVSFLVASPAAVGDAFHISNSSGTNLSGSAAVPATGGYQTWTTVKANVTLSAGTQTLTVNQDGAGWNIDSMAFASSGGGSCTTKPNAPTGLAASGTSSTGTNLNWTATTAPANCSISSYTVLKNGASIGTATGTSFAVSGLTASTNYSFTVEATDAAGTSAASSAVSVTTTASGGGGEGPYPGPGAAAVPGTVMAENYDTGGQGVGYNVTSTNGTANSYRAQGVDLEAASAPATGNDLGWSAAGQWFRYTVSVAAAGSYKISFLVASPTAVGDAFHLSNSSGINLTGSVAVPATGGYQTWVTVTATVTLPAGTQTLTLNEDAAGWNIDSMVFASSGGGGTGTPVIQIDSGGAASGTWVADTDFTGGTAVTTTNTVTTSGVTNPAPQAVYQSNRYGSPTAPTYTIGGLTAGTSYTVRMHFAETYWTAAAKREFNVSINGTQVLTNFDIFATAGGENIANVQQFTATANGSGQIVITTTNVIDYAQFNGIEVDH